MTWDLVRTVLTHPATLGFGMVLVGLPVVGAVATLFHRRLVRVGRPHYALIVRMGLLYGGIAVVLLTAAQTAGIDLTALIATAGIATVAVGLAAQTSLGNLIAGVFVLLDRPFEVGDTIEIDGRTGVVRELRLLSTRVSTFDNVIVRWPNEVVLKATILNYTRQPARRVDVKVGVAYGSDVKAARKAILRALEASDAVLVDPPPEVWTRGFLDSAVELEVRGWVQQGGFLQGRQAIVEGTHSALREAGITIPFPQLQIWTDKGRP